jgi:hypothetical protein
MRKILFACLGLLLLCSCRRFATQGFNTYFWTSTSDTKVFLYIDGHEEGELPYLPKAPDCDEEESKQAALRVYLPSGSYDVQLRNDKREILFAEILKIRRSGGDVSIGTTSTGDDDGGSRRTFKDSCLIEELFYTKP